MDFTNLIISLHTLSLDPSIVLVTIHRHFLLVATFSWLFNGITVFIPACKEIEVTNFSLSFKNFQLFIVGNSWPIFMGYFWRFLLFPTYDVEFRQHFSTHFLLITAQPSTFLYPSPTYIPTHLIIIWKPMHSSQQSQHLPCFTSSPN